MIDTFERDLINAYGENVYTVHAYSQNISGISRQTDNNVKYNWCRRVGTAYLFDDSGHLVTFHSVVEDAARINVLSHDNVRMYAQILEGHVPSRIDVLSVERKVHAPVAPKLPFHSVRQGLDVVFLSPVDSEMTVVHGTVREKNSADGTIIVTVTGEPGTSGTPVFDLESRLVGFLAYQISTEPPSSLSQTSPHEYAYVVIPAESAYILAHSIVNCADSECGWLGIASSANDAYQGLEGIIIKHVIEGSPADKAGLLVNDCIFEFNGKRMNSPVELIEEISTTSAGDTVSVKIRRNGKIILEQVTLSRHPMTN